MTEEEVGEKAKRSLLNGVRIVLVSLMLLPIVLCRLFLIFSKKPFYDFMTYWASGRLFLTGKDPYSASAVYVMENSLGYHGELQTMLNPPWTLPMVSVLGVGPFSLMHLVWFVVVLILETLSVLMLWHYFGGARKQSWIALAVLGTYFPAAIAEQVGQITPLMLFGLAVFLWMERRGQYRIASAGLFLLSLKPHLVWLVALAVFLWAIQIRKYYLIFVPCLLCLTFTLFSLWVNPSVWGYFHQTTQAAIESRCGLAFILGPEVSRSYPGLRFLPMLIGLVWFAWIWQKYRACWRWEEQIPLLLLVSIGTAPYYWPHDYVIALPAMVAVAVKASRCLRQWHLVFVCWFLCQITMLGVNQFTRLMLTVVAVKWIIYWVLSMYLLADHCVVGIGLPVEETSCNHPQPEL